MEVWVDLGELKDSPSDQLPGFNERLMSWLPTMIEHRCGIGVRGGFFERLRTGTYLGHILEHVTLELQSLAGTPVGFGKARETSEEGVYKVVIRYDDETLGRECLYAARELCLAAIYDRPYDVAAEIRRLHNLADDVCLGPSTRAIVDAANARGIPAQRLNAGSLVQLGYGARQRRVWTAESDQTSAIAEWIAQDKQLTRSLLVAAGVPVPEGRAVVDADDAWEAAREIGLPVVVKPRKANHGRGVFTNLATEEQVRSAYAHAVQEGCDALVERFVPGAEHRLLMVGGKLIAAARGDAATVTGDGIHMIAELIELQLNSDPRRGEQHSQPLYRIELTPAVRLELERQGYQVDSVPPAGAVVLVQRNGNLALDVTEQVHPEIVARAALAAQVVGLDIAGLDVIATDISRPLEEQGGAIVEVNSGPGLQPHLNPAGGPPRDVGGGILETLFPPGSTGRIPIVAVTGTNGKTSVVRLVAHILQRSGHRTGVACSDGIFLEGRKVEGGDCAGPRSARSVLLNPRIEAAVLEAGRGGILREGLGFDKCDVAVVTNIADADHLGQYDINTPEAMFTVKRTPVDVILPTGTAVLNANDPLVADMAELSHGSVTFFAEDENHPVIARHRDAGGRAVFVRHNAIALAAGAETTVLMSLRDVPLLRHAPRGFPLENVLAAVAAVWGLNTPAEDIRAGVASFSGDPQSLPGRFNVLNLRGGTVVIDDCHNSSALTALARVLDPFPAKRRTIVYSVEGDRRDEDIIRQGQLLGDLFDGVILYESRWRCGRAEGEIPRLLREGIARGKRVSEFSEIPSPADAVREGLRRIAAGELMVIQCDSIEETLRLVQEHGHSNGSEPIPVLTASRE